MTEANRPTPGKLFYVVGASGAGKDSIIAGFREKLRQEHGCRVAHRYITRKPDPEGEDHVALTDEEFHQRRILGEFCMAWTANGHQYGISTEIDRWLAQGLNVIVNGSRAYLQDAIAQYGPQLVTVWIKVDPSVLRDRLTARGRESAVAIEQRITRAALLDDVIPASARVLTNDGPLSEAVSGLLAIVEGQEPAPAGAAAQ
ncbi:MAG: ribose 1,5-bisphosphokinase [Alteromonadaceae bacterium]|uniref:phosphonate metabolism protein/1,5-bisphosphokinase (PRPP-forming) PhnN n=1 Tax=Marinobacter sp. V034 TaxID=3459610 RepID=UPI000C46B01B|nr:ribose 1,5-bisphosphokinase [Alteromonadaceae bacterium]MBH83923.1 ribose 1,5-bisphosphokinase [Alteromonadaceae bacterium]|tara:strand:- start:11420 stop:12022 length:603 start_codon:yes stop_codon:yes gene_type:complete